MRLQSAITCRYCGGADMRQATHPGFYVEHTCIRCGKQAQITLLDPKRRARKCS